MYNYKKASIQLAKKKKAIVGSSADNTPFVKTMLVTKREGTKTFYFASNNSSVRTAQFLNNPNACLYFFGGLIYKGVMLSGKMEVLNDEATKKEFWSPKMKSAYPLGYGDFCVLRFTAEKARFYRMFRSVDFDVE